MHPSPHPHLKPHLHPDPSPEPEPTPEQVGEWTPLDFAVACELPELVARLLRAGAEAVSQRPLPSAHCPLPTAHCPNCPLPTAVRNTFKWYPLPHPYLWPLPRATARSLLARRCAWTRAARATRAEWTMAPASQTVRTRNGARWPSAICFGHRSCPG